MSALIEFDEVCKYYQMGDTTVIVSTALEELSLQGG